MKGSALRRVHAAMGGRVGNRCWMDEMSVTRVVAIVTVVTLLYAEAHALGFVIPSHRHAALAHTPEARGGEDDGVGQVGRHLAIEQALDLVHLQRDDDLDLIELLLLEGLELLNLLVRLLERLVAATRSGQVRLGQGRLG